VTRAERRVRWRPPARPGWLERLIAHGDSVGGAEHMVSLDADELVDRAVRSTGLEDFGGEAWRTPYGVLLAALEGESKLHLAGRLVARSEILRALRNRLELAALWGRNPGMLDAPVEAPVFIVGSPRSGTSILHELMACDPASRAPAMWEMQHPVAAATGADLSQPADAVSRFWADLQPEYDAMHTNSGHLPNECIFITLHEFLSDHWSGVHQVPSYASHLARADHHVAYRTHRKFLQTLQSRGGSRRWVLKAPSHLFQLRALFDVYPDARIVRTHRDPVATLPSALSLMATLRWMRCREVDVATAAAQLPLGFAAAFRAEIRDRTSGRLPDVRFVDVHFAQLAKDPVATVRGVYARLGWPFTPDVAARVADYAARKPRDAHGVHRYSADDFGLDAAELRESFGFYREHYGVAEEEPGRA